MHLTQKMKEAWQVLMTALTTVKSSPVSNFLQQSFTNSTQFKLSTCIKFAKKTLFFSQVHNFSSCFLPPSKHNEKKVGFFYSTLKFKVNSLLIVWEKIKTGTCIRTTHIVKYSCHLSAGEAIIPVTPTKYSIKMQMTVTLLSLLSGPTCIWYCTLIIPPCYKHS